ncbi:hypothetical protein PYK79_19120 [Streptomyces sp. ID05-04B]|nr:hypothetical protein [Streptomyces sp. ID05-04B]
MDRLPGKAEDRLTHFYDLHMMSDLNPADGRLQTVRLSLWRPVESDIDAIFAIHRDPETCLHNPSDALPVR